jgi:antitoxin VapB
MSEERRVKLLRRGGRQVVYIPAEFELPGTEATLRREAERLVIQPIRRRNLLSLLKTFDPLDEPFDWD